MSTALVRRACALAAAAGALAGCSHHDVPPSGARSAGMARQLQDARSAYLNGQISKQQYERERSTIMGR